MKATLYLPNKEPVEVSSEGLYLPDSETELVPVSKKAALLLGCPLSLVDILACGPKYVVYTVFNNEGPPNLEASAVLSSLLDTDFNADDDGGALRGPVLVAQA